jgi:hypothetical protein
MPKVQEFTTRAIGSRLKHIKVVIKSFSKEMKRRKKIEFKGGWNQELTMQGRWMHGMW